VFRPSKHLLTGSDPIVFGTIVATPQFSHFEDEMRPHIVLLVENQLGDPFGLSRRHEETKTNS
jgi:hypothetical protein